MFPLKSVMACVHVVEIQRCAVTCLVTQAGNPMARVKFVPFTVSLVRRGTNPVFPGLRHSSYLTLSDPYNGPVLDIEMTPWTVRKQRCWRCFFRMRMMSSVLSRMKIKWAAQPDSLQKCSDPIHCWPLQIFELWFGARWAVFRLLYIITLWSENFHRGGLVVQQVKLLLIASTQSIRMFILLQFWSWKQ